MAKKNAYKSRRTRCGEWAAVVKQIAEDARFAAAQIEGDDFDLEQLRDVRSLVESFYVDLSEVQALKDEVDNWKNPMTGTPLVTTRRYDMLRNAADRLNSILKALEPMEPPSWPVDADPEEFEKLKNDLEEFADVLEAQAAVAEQIDFPGLYR